MRISSETYADFTLSRIPRAVRESLSDEQYFAVRDALIAREQSARHAIDFRVSIPLFLRSYYVVLFAGRDRRVSRSRLEDSRWAQVPRPLRIMAWASTSALISLTLLMVVFLVLYKFKNFLGIDLFPGFHLTDLLEMARLSAVPQAS